MSTSPMANAAQPPLTAAEDARITLPVDSWSNSRALAIAVGDFEEMSNFRNTSGHDIRLQIAEELYLGWQPKKYWEGTRIPRSSLGVPISMDQVEALMPPIMASIFPLRDNVDISPNPGTSQDEAVATLYQLMREPGTLNTKGKGAYVECVQLYGEDVQYTCEEFNKLLPPITTEDEAYCQEHYNRTHNIDQDNTAISEELPPKFGRLIRDNTEAKELWTGNTDDRSKSDYRLGHIMFASGFTKDEALSVLVNSAKALQRAPTHRNNYAINIVDKIWTFELAGEKEGLSQSVLDILSRGDHEYLKGRRFPCYQFFDGSEHGFRLTQVIGLCAGVGVGKTAIALNLFKGFVEQNPDYIHMFISLEQPGREIALRWSKMCGNNTTLHKKVHVLSNYNEDGSYRNLSLTEIQDYILNFQKETGAKVGCVCLDHIGVLRQENKAGEYQGLRDICAQMKSFAVATQTLFVVQSQTNREKAGVGDLELFKDAAYGTQSFESFVDFMLVAWQPLKRCYDHIACPRVTAYKFAKVRAKSKNDVLIEDQCYRLFFEQDTETLRPMTQDEEVSFDYFAKLAVNLRKKDRKTDLVTYVSTNREDYGKT